MARAFSLSFWAVVPRLWLCLPLLVSSKIQGKKAEIKSIPCPNVVVEACESFFTRSEFSYKGGWGLWVIGEYGLSAADGLK